jgi:Protein of unknown function (DUF1194)
MDRVPRIAAIVAVALALAGARTDARAGGVIVVDEAIVFALDVSLSMDAGELRIAREGLAEAIGAPGVLEAIERGAIGRVAVTYVEFAGSARQVVDWMIIDGPAAAERFGSAVRAVESPTEAYTDIASALYLANTLFSAMPYDATTLVVDVVGDGMDPGITWLAATRDQLLHRGVVINGMPLMIDPSQPEVATFYATALVGGPGHFSMPVTRIEQMPDALRRKIMRELF